MGFAASQARVLMLTARNHDLSFQIQLMSNSLQQLANATLRMIPFAVNLQPNSPESQQLLARQAQTSQMEKSLNLQLEVVRAQQKAVQTELEAVQKTISDNITHSFKTFANT